MMMPRVEGNQKGDSSLPRRRNDGSTEMESPRIVLLVLLPLPVPDILPLPLRLLDMRWIQAGAMWVVWCVVAENDSAGGQEEERCGDVEESTLCLVAQEQDIAAHVVKHLNEPEKG